MFLVVPVECYCVVYAGVVDARRLVDDCAFCDACWVWLGLFGILVCVVRWCYCEAVAALVVCRGEYDWAVCVAGLGAFC